MNKLPIEINILITGIIIVFFILTVLTFAIKLYGILVSNINNRISKQEHNSKPNNIKQKDNINCDMQNKEDVNTDISDEIIAVISASVYSLYNDDSNRVIIKSIRREKYLCNNSWKLVSNISTVKNI